MGKRQRSISWTNKLFLENPELYFPILYSMKDLAVKETDWLVNIFEENGIYKGSKILDLSCGIGRHAIPLAKRGYSVVGYDPSKYFILEAKNSAKAEINVPSTVRFYNGPAGKANSVLSTRGETGFDAIIIMFNSFGYSSVENDKKILLDAYKLASSECLLITQTENRDWRIRNFQPFISYEFEDISIFENWSFDMEKSLWSGLTRFYHKTNPNNLQLKLELTVKLRLYSLHELVYLINSAGWKYIRSYGELNDRGRAHYNAENILTLSRKK